MEENGREWLTFDIETEAWPDDEDHRRDLGVTCLAWAIDSEVAHIPLSPDGGGRFGERLDRVALEAFVLTLSQMAAYGYKIATINGLGFDFPVLAAAVPDMRDALRALALDSYDPAFQMLAEKGFMVGLDALAVGLELTERKTEDMTGAKAVTMWESGNLDLQRQVIKYVRQDARVTLGIMQALESKRWSWEQYDHELRGTVRYTDRQAIRWQTKKGHIAYHCLEHGLLTVRECLALPLPDTDWMKKSGNAPWPRERFAGWVQGE